MKLIAITSFIATSLLCFTHFIYAQDQVIDLDQSTPTVLTDANVIQKLQNDWSKRNSTIQNETVKWYESGDFFLGTYTHENQQYMTLYDPEGYYVETLKKVVWNSKVPNPIRSSFDLSNYRKREVTSYWEVSDAGRKGYYLELTDDLGKDSRFWVNEKGDFSSTPPAGVKRRN